MDKVTLVETGTKQLAEPDATVGNIEVRRVVNGYRDVLVHRSLMSNC